MDYQKKLNELKDEEYKVKYGINTEQFERLKAELEESYKIESKKLLHDAIISAVFTLSFPILAFLLLFMIKP